MFILFVESASDFDGKGFVDALTDSFDGFEAVFFVFHHVTSSSTRHHFGGRATDVQFYPPKSWIFLINIDGSFDEGIHIPTIYLGYQFAFLIMMDEVFDHLGWLYHITIGIHEFCPTPERWRRFWREMGRLLGRVLICVKNVINYAAKG